MFIYTMVIALMTTNTTITKSQLLELTKENPFFYDLGVKIIPSKNKNAGVMLCCHGYGHNNRIADVLQALHVIPDHLVSFNFPDYGITPETDYTKTTFGTFDEIAPLVYLLKRCVIDLKLTKINLFGFSAGAAAIINAIATLNTNRHDAELQDLHITAQDKKQILHALEHGLVILDCPLKSMEEVIAIQGSQPEFELYKIRYTENGMRPIDNVSKFAGLKLHILLGLQNPDEIVGNTTDTLFIDQLRAGHAGTTDVVIGSDGGHNSYHASLWKAYKKSKSR